LTYPHIGNTGTNPEEVRSRAKSSAAGLGDPRSAFAASNWRQDPGSIVIPARTGCGSRSPISTPASSRGFCARRAAQDWAASWLPWSTRPKRSNRTRVPALPAWILRESGEFAASRTTGMKRHGRSARATAARSRPKFNVGRVRLRHQAQHPAQACPRGGCKVTVIPAQSTASDALAYQPDGIFLSNGPGDPEPVRLRNPRDPRTACCRHADLRHLPRPPVAQARERRAHGEDEFGHHGANHRCRISTPGA